MNNNPEQLVQDKIISFLKNIKLKNMQDNTQRGVKTGEYVAKLYNYIIGNDKYKLLKKQLKDKSIKSLEEQEFNEFFYKIADISFEEIYSYKMPDNTFIERSEEKKERETHGRRHVSRAAILVERLANIIQCDNKITRYAQIGAIFHDSCRMGDGKDYWESESYYLFTLILEDLFCNEQNPEKDATEKEITNIRNIFINSHKEGGHKEGDDKEAQLIKILVQSADCIEIMRVREGDNFNLSFLTILMDLHKKPEINKDKINAVFDLIEAHKSLCDYGRQFTGGILPNFYLSETDVDNTYEDKLVMLNSTSETTYKLINNKDLKYLMKKLPEDCIKNEDLNNKCSMKELRDDYNEKYQDLNMSQNFRKNSSRVFFAKDSDYEITHEANNTTIAYKGLLGLTETRGLLESVGVKIEKGSSWREIIIKKTELEKFNSTKLDLTAK